MNRILRYRITPIVAALGLSCWSLQIFSPVENPLMVLLAIGSATWIIYPLDPILDPRDRNPGENIRVWTVIRLLTALSIFVYSILELRTEAKYLAILGLPAAICYAIPFKGRRIKDRSLTKIPFISLAVSIACIGIPWLQSGGVQSLQAMVGFALMFLLLSSNVIVCDLRDRLGDQMSGLHTIATDRPATALKIIRGLFFLICLLAWIGINEPATISIGQGIGVLLATIVLNFAAVKNQQPVMTTLLADGALTLPALCGTVFPI